jgi:hypothetical protein
MGSLVSHFAVKHTLCGVFPMEQNILYRRKTVYVVFKYLSSTESEGERGDWFEYRQLRYISPSPAWANFSIMSVRLKAAVPTLCVLYGEGNVTRVE